MGRGGHGRIHHAHLRTLAQHMCAEGDDDLATLEAAHDLRPLIVDHPHKGLVSGKSGCPVCGSVKLQKRGFHVARTRKFQRFHCQQCGAWSKGSTAVAKAPNAVYDR